MTDNMIEKVARTLARSAGHNPDEMCNGHIPSQPAEPRWHFFRHAARAAIEAMREPTPGMVTAGADSVSRTDFHMGESSTATECYRAMIDAALEEKK